MEFSPGVMEHFDHPRCIAPLQQWSGEGDTFSRGMHMQIQVRVEDGNICGIRFATFGCVPAIACGSWLCAWALGRTAEGAMQMTARGIIQGLGGLPPARRFCADLALGALRAALANAGGGASR